MTIIEPRPITLLRPVVHDLYRDIHKGIRAELFAVTETAGALDPGSDDDRAALAAHVGRVVELLVNHAEHEDTHMQPVIEQHLPALAEQIEDEHHRIETRLLELGTRADELAAVPNDQRWHAHAFYIDFAAFTSSYLAHQDLEERMVMPALEDAIGPEACFAMNQALVGSIPPDELVSGLAVMLPAMNVDDASEMLGGMQAGAPAEVFAGVWKLALSVLDRPKAVAIAARLGL